MTEERSGVPWACCPPSASFSSKLARSLAPVPPRCLTYTSMLITKGVLDESSVPPSDVLSEVGSDLPCVSQSNV